MPDPSLFKTAPKEVVDYFDRRPSVPTFDWRDIAPHEHALGYTVAKTAGFDVLDDLRVATRKAAMDRIPYEQFRDELIPVLRQKGWWGVKKLRDPKTGEMVKAQLGSLRRLETIYWGNVYSSYAAGEWARTQRNKTFLPWLTYMPSVSERKRPEHQSWYGVTLRVDDSWWRSHYPPNGWKCKCSVRQIGDMEAEALHKEHGKSTAPPLDEQPWVNKRTSHREMIPKGIDPGWQTNPGLLRDRTVSMQLQGALDRMPEEARRRAVSALARHPLAEYIASGKAGRDNHVAVAVLSADLVQGAGARSAVVKMSGEIGQKAVRLGKSGRAHHPEATPEAFAGLQSIVDRGAIIRDGEREFRIEASDEDGLIWRAAIRRTNAGDEWFLSTLYKIDALRAAKDRATRMRRGEAITPEVLREEKI